VLPARRLHRRRSCPCGPWYGRSLSRCKLPWFFLPVFFRIVTQPVLCYNRFENILREAAP
jgi:hypothetical protein